MKKKTKKQLRIRVAGIITKGDKILLVNHVRDGRSYYLLPGGGLEWGETCQHGLQREFKEELSVDINVGKLIAVNESISPDGDRHILNLTFKATLPGKQTLKVNEDQRLRGACWMDKKIFKTILFYPQIRSVILKTWRQKFATGAKMINTPWI